MNGRVWELVKADGDHEDSRQLDVTISVRVSFSEVVFAKYSLPLNGCIYSNYFSI